MGMRSRDSSGCRALSAPTPCDIQHAVGVGPFVVEPHQDFHQLTADARLAGIDNAGARIVVEITGGERLFGVTQNILQRTFRSRAQRAIDRRVGFF